MIICCHTELNKNWNSDELLQKISLLPFAERVKTLRKQPKDIQLSTCGKLLLIQVLKEFGLDLPLVDMKFTEYQRPFFDADFDFNISHSGNRVICCGSDKGKIGADIELIKPIDFDDYATYFNKNEWNIILNSPDKNTAFFKCWTRKEAVLKADGAGFYLPLQEMDVSAESVAYNNYIYHLSEVKLADDYQCHMAATVKQDVTVIEVKH